MMTSLFLAMMMASALDDEKVFSGPQAGEKLTSFKAVGVHDDQDGKEIDFIKQADGKPTLLIFMHEPTRPSAALTRMLSVYADSRKKDGLQCCVVWLTADRTEAAAYLKRARMSLNLKSQVLISTEGIEGPGGYGLNRKVGLTVLVAKDNKVTANFALVQPAMTDAPKIAEAIVKHVGGKAPELKELEELAGIKRGPMDRDPTLVGMMRQMIQKDATEEGLRKTAAEIEKYVANDPGKQKQVFEIATAIVANKYGTEAAQKQMKEWIETYKPRSR
jgi:hypothetical protein